MDQLVVLEQPALDFRARLTDPNRSTTAHSQTHNGRGVFLILPLWRNCDGSRSISYEFRKTAFGITMIRARQTCNEIVVLQFHKRIIQDGSLKLLSLQKSAIKRLRLCRPGRLTLMAWL